MVRKLPPIPKYCLIHNVKYKPQNQPSDGWGRGLGDEVDISKVLVVETISYQPNETGVKLPMTRTTLYYDYKHSTPDNVNFQNDDIIIWQGQSYKIISVQGDPFNAHHKELGLEVS